ncbi:hypothetical protein TUBRATIS_26260 [Tubulinosema ratisbonensis]|uniref:SWIM-type domain-containing protein n=1 Tax=Tubulinosema ratisbonensis TaxID=291195 RepID=A0A437AID6_9MICR|nr:hypothetical protein TUBRATIS_26260 [Tubulinosema ratisbonensis]
MLSINDSFKSRQELLDALTKHISLEKYSYYLKETPKHIKLVCKGKAAFYCEAQIIAINKKRDSLFQIRKIRPHHKCPTSYHSNKNYLREEISKIKEYKNIQELVEKLPAKISYLTAWKTLTGREETTYKYKPLEHDEIRNEMIDNNQDFYLDDDSDCYDEPPELHSETLLTVKKEFKEKNPESINLISGNLKKEEEENKENEEKKDKIKKIKLPTLDYNSSDASFYFSFPSTINLLRNIIDLKIYLRKKGCVIYGIGYDPHDKPIPVSVLVSEMNVSESLEVFFNFEKETQKKCKNELFYFCDYEINLVKKLQSLKVNFFIKSRSIIKKIGKDDLEKTFKALNYEKEPLSELSWIDPKNYLVLLNPPFFGLNNFGEVDVEFIYYSIYNTTYIDCILAIIKFISDYYAEILTKSNEVKFGNNVNYRLERNIKNKIIDEHVVDPSKMTCTCGRFQAFMIPCIHACAITKDPINFVSNIYNMEIMKDLLLIKPIFELATKYQADRFLLRRGPGRPKKSQGIPEKKV